MQNIDYAKIMFSKSDIKLLQSLDEKHPKHLQHDKYVSFSQYDFVTPHVIGQDKYGAEILDETYYITDAGKTYLQYLKSKRREKISSGVRRWITTVISVLAFILSIVNLIWKEWK